MIIAIPKDTDEKERRAAIIPDHVRQLCNLGAIVRIESGLGEGIHVSDFEYREAGAQIASDKKSLLTDGDMVVYINKPSFEEIALLKEGCITIGYLDPYNERELIERCAKFGIRSISVEMIPRTTRAQKLDVLSSQANLVGYAMVIIAAERINKIFPMMMTPAGTIAPSRIFVIGAGVAGLQAIATAKRLGARVEAFDTRDVVAEQVQSLGAKFIKLDIGETGQTKDGYAKVLTKEQLELQRKGLAKVCAYSDIVITTAQIPGRRAPRILTKDMISGMKPGSVVVDMAVSSGGNVEGSEIDKEVNINGVIIIGLSNFPSRVSTHASQMYSSNIYNFIEEFWDKENGNIQLNHDDEIISGCLITENGRICNETIKKHYQTSIR